MPTKKTKEGNEPIILNMYKGKCEVKFFPETHVYMVNGERKTGVTTILGIIDKSRPLITWATELYRDFLLEKVSKKITEEDIWTGSTLHSERKKEAADVGSKIHSWIESHVKGENPDMPDEKEVQIGVTAFLSWKQENKVSFISSERVVYSKKHDYVGKMDIEARVGGRLCLIDIKSSNALYNTYNLQTAAYVMADEEESGRNYKGRWLIRVAKETEQEYISRMNKKNVMRVQKGQKIYDFPPYKAFEAKFLDDELTNIGRDFKAFLAAKELYTWNKDTDYFLNK